MRKLWAILLTVVMGVSLTGCGSNGAADTSKVAEDKKVSENKVEGKKQKVTVWAWDPNFNIAVMNEAKTRYEKENPNVEIEVMDFAKADVEQKLHTNLASGSTKGLPEIVLIEDYNAQKYLQSYPGAFYDLTDKIKHENFASYKVGLMLLDNKVYGVPFDSGVCGFYYRNDILEEAGYKAEDLVNITWDEYIEIGKAVKEKTGKYMLTLDPSDGGMIRTMLQSAGSWYFDAFGNPKIKDNEAMKEALRIHKEIMDAGIAKPITGWSEFVGGFNSGDVASVVTGVWITASVMAEESQSGLWTVAPVPKMNTGGAVAASNLGGSSWYVLSDSPNKDIAVDFLNKVFASDEDFYQTILADIGAVGTYLPGTTGEAYSKNSEFFGGQAIYTDFANWMSEIPSVNYGMYTYEADSVIMGEFINILQGVDIDKALSNAEEQIKQQIQ